MDPSSSSFGGGLHLQTAVQRKLKKIKHKLPQGVPGSSHYGHGGHGGHGGEDNPSEVVEVEPVVLPDIAPLVPGTTDTEGWEVSVQAFSMRDYEKREVICYITQLVDPEVPLRPTNPGHEKALLTSMENGGFDYALGYMKVTPRREDCGSDTRQFLTSSLREEPGGRYTLKEGSVLEVVDGGHRKKIIADAVANSNPKMEWATRTMHFILYTRRDGKPLSAWEKILIAKNANVGAGLVLVDRDVISILGNIRSYARAFEMEYGVKFLDSRTTDIVQDMFTGGFLGDLARQTYRRYVRVGKLAVAYDGLINHLEMLAKDGDGSVIGLTHLDDSVLMTCGRLFLPLLLTALDNFLRKCGLE